MRRTTSLLVSLSLLAGLVTAAPRPTESCEPRILCVDAINTCGMRYGACYDVCNTAAKPAPPPCPKTTSSSSASSSSVPTPLVTALPTSACPNGSNGTGATVCWDGINACGKMYGG
ncbi:hypothetical protein B0H66DRAFT_610510 [Apodospora peruviana]|uniref:Uncharacterized protein n=1 Tax=Apodospora peruviana TaxID=516989 RepID=A0AAE0IR19_9PEZI|nr:hypothetical protein B0H66DRAFT_610510 [Apodospora peruviana]